jgi:hypothetical protein
MRSIRQEEGGGGQEQEVGDKEIWRLLHVYYEDSMNYSKHRL